MSPIQKAKLSAYFEKIVEIQNGLSRMVSELKTDNIEDDTEPFNLTVIENAIEYLKVAGFDLDIAIGEKIVGSIDL